MRHRIAHSIIPPTALMRRDVFRKRKSADARLGQRENEILEAVTTAHVLRAIAPSALDCLEVSWQSCGADLLRELWAVFCFSWSSLALPVGARRCRRSRRICL